MLDLTIICQPGDRITLVTKDKIIVGNVLPPDTVLQEPAGETLFLHTQGSLGCAVEVVLVRERGQD